MTEISPATIPAVDAGALLYSTFEHFQLTPMLDSRQYQRHDPNNINIIEKCRGENEKQLATGYSDMIEKKSWKGQ